MPVTATHTVILDYTIQDGRERLVQPPTIPVKKGDTIAFQRGPSVPEGLTIFVQFAEEFFSKQTFDEGDHVIEVMQDLPHRTTYQCGLKGPDHQLIQSTLTGPSDADMQAGIGGDIDPAGGGPVG
jgi:hypothetical protein